MFHETVLRACWADNVSVYSVGMDLALQRDTKDLTD